VQLLRELASLLDQPKLDGTLITRVFDSCVGFRDAFVVDDLRFDYAVSLVQRFMLFEGASNVSYRYREKLVLE
jgi:hypothetical protein